MSGYTPLFRSITTGTLFGRWPDIGLWGIVLSLADWRGHVDVTHEYIAGVTGLAISEVIACMKRFCAPDPGSRSPEERGARLVLLDAGRQWGWRVVNLSKYRELASSQVQVGDGRNAEKVRRYRERHGLTPGGRHRDTPEHTCDLPETPTHTHTQTQTQSKNKNGADAPMVVHESLPSEEWEQWLGHRRKRKWPCDAVTLGKQLAILKPYDTATQREILNNSIQAGWQGLFPPKGRKETPKPSTWKPPQEVPDVPR